MGSREGQPRNPALASCTGGCRAGDAGGVVAEGEAGLAWRASRETRLTAWAADLFQQLASLRQDLREARLEVVGAKEVSRAALKARRQLPNGSARVAGPAVLRACSPDQEQER